MINASKQYTYKERPARIYADGSDTYTGWIHGATHRDGYWFPSTFRESDLVEVWEPVAGEIVWFWDNCTPHRPTAREFGCQSIGDNGVLYFEDSEQNPFTNCAPFTGTLPKELK